MQNNNKKNHSLQQNVLIEVITLKTARGRLVIFISLTLAIFFVPYHWLDHLSLWGHLGLQWMPSIGLTRAYWRLLHGNIDGAWQRNPLIFVVLAIGLPLLARDARSLLAHSRRNEQSQEIVV